MTICQATDASRWLVRSQDNQTADSNRQCHLHNVSVQFQKSPNGEVTLGWPASSPVVDGEFLASISYTDELEISMDYLLKRRKLLRIVRLNVVACFLLLSTLLHSPEAAEHLTQRLIVLVPAEFHDTLHFSLYLTASIGKSACTDALPTASNLANVKRVIG